jgi:hypothetical protein
MSHDTMMTLQDAARFLSVTDRTVRNYIKKGLLSKEKKGRGVFLRPEEVQSLKEDMDSAAPIVSRQELVRLRAKVRRLESHMEVVLRILDAKDAALGLSPSYSEELYAFAVAHTKKGSWQIEEISPWVEIFDRLSENDFAVMAGQTSDTHPWRVFLRLCTMMMGFVVSHPEYSSSLEMQGTHKILASSRRRLRISAFIYGELSGTMASELESRHVGTSTTSDALFRKILKRGENMA